MLGKEELEKIDNIKKECDYIAYKLICNSTLYDGNAPQPLLNEKDISFLTKAILKHDYLKDNRTEKEIREDLKEEKDLEKKIELSDEFYSVKLYKEAKLFLQRGHIDGFTIEDCRFILDMKKDFYRNLAALSDNDFYIKETNLIEDQIRKIAVYLGVLRKYFDDEKVSNEIRKNMVHEKNNEGRIDYQNQCLDLYNEYKKTKDLGIKKQIEKYAKKAHMDDILKSLD